MDFHGIEKLYAENWVIWKFAIKNLWRATEGAYEVYIGLLEKPVVLGANATPEQTAVYNAKVMALLIACDSARQMWLKLHVIFEQQTKQAAHAVQSEFFSFCMALGDDMITHLARFESLVLRLQQLNVKSDESALMVRLLDTLPESYENL